MAKMRPVCHQSRYERDQINAKTAEALRRKGEGEKEIGTREWGGLHREDRVTEDTERKGNCCGVCFERYVSMDLKNAPRGGRPCFH